MLAFIGITILWSTPAKSPGQTVSVDTSCVASPFYITPMLDAIGYYVDKNGNLDGSQVSGQITNLLNQVEPGGAKGKVQVGYTLNIPIFSLFTKNQGVWEFDNNKFQPYLDIIKNTDRPVVVFLYANHFSPLSPLTSELQQDKNNLMLLNDSSVPQSTYFQTEVLPFTLSADEAIPVNKYRTIGMARVLESLKAIDQKDPSKIVGVTLAGEIHQMFNNLMTAPGDFNQRYFTDYSEHSIKDFRQWLHDNFASLDELNNQAGTHFTTWESVMPPSKNLYDQKGESWEHFDSFASGNLPIFGWMYDAQKSFKVTVYLDGAYQGEAEQGYGRLDVSESNPSVLSPNTGYRYNLDYSKLSAGSHTIEVKATYENGNQALIGKRTIYVNDSKTSPLKKQFVTSSKDALPAVSAALDWPTNNLNLNFNPYAAIWQRFREYQVENFLNVVWDQSVATGFDRQKLFTHQIAPELNGSWNDALFGTNGNFSTSSHYQAGLNLYGGLTKSDLILKKTRGKRYALPEFNTLMPNNPNWALEALKFQHDNCAKFVSPYFMTIYPKDKQRDVLGRGGNYGNFLVAPDNPRKGQDLFYKAIASYAQE
ncbi:MAG TPA: beta-galactosidase [Candidatus Saccharimonadales bacterium]|nr:beta-galactosidase [Candidatus Saccharimonadales bacterium]